MPNSKQAENPDFLKQMMQSPTQTISQQPYNTPAEAVDFNIRQFLTEPTGWYGRTKSGV